MSAKHVEPGIVDIDELLLRWPVGPVRSTKLKDEAHHHAVEFKKQSGAAPEDLDELMNRHNQGADLDDYFEKRLQHLQIVDR